MRDPSVFICIPSFHNNNLNPQFFNQFFKNDWFVVNEYDTSELVTISSILFLLSFENYFMIITCLLSTSEGWSVDEI